MTGILDIALPDPAATDALGARLAATRPPQAVVYLQGELGAGKSTLARALLRALGVTGTIRSPTYTLVERYELPQPGAPAGAGAAEAVHLDLYRIAAADELDFLALDEFAGSAALWLIEWPERGGGALPDADLEIALEVVDDGRAARLKSRTINGLAWISRITGTTDA